MIYKNHGGFVDGKYFFRREGLGKNFNQFLVGRKVRYNRKFNNTYWQASDITLVE